MKNWPGILIVCAVMIMVSFAKCQGDMEDGFLLENQGYDLPYTFTELVPGPPKVRFVGGVETKVKLQVHAYHCTKCGYIEIHTKQI